MDAPTGLSLIVGLNYAPEVTGIAPYTTGLAEALARSLGQVSVVTTHPHYPEWKRHPDSTGWRSLERRNGVHVTRVLHFVPNGRSNVQRAMSEISFGLRAATQGRRRPERVILVSPALISSLIVALASRFRWRRVPIVVWVQDIYTSGLSETGVGGGLTSRVFRTMERALLRVADLVVVIHENFKETVTRDLRVPDAKVRIVRNWSHLREFPPMDRQNMRNRLGWADDEFIVLHTGNMGAKQGLASVVEAAKSMPAAAPRVRFVLMGDGSTRRDLEAQAGDCSSISFVDPLSEDLYLSALRSADLLLVNELPALREMAVPSKLTSYFRSGIAVLAATDAASTTSKEIAASGGGVRVEPGNPEALVSAVYKLRSDAGLRARLGEAGRRFCEENLSSEAATQHYADLLSNLTTRRGHR